MIKRPKHHFESYESACADLKLDPEAMLPPMSESAPEWLKKYTVANTKLVLIAEAMRQGRKPKPGEWMYVPVFFKDAKNNNAGFGFTYVNYGILDFAYGCRGAPFTFYRGRC